MGTAVLIVVLVAAVVFGVKSYMKKLSSGCCGTSVEKEKRIGARDSDETHYPYAYEITVEGMHCGNCAMRLENAFHGQKEGIGTGGCSACACDPACKRACGGRQDSPNYCACGV